MTGGGGHGGGGDNHGGDGDRKVDFGYFGYYGWLLISVVGMMSTLTLYGITLEYVTSGEKKLHEISFLFVTTSIYALTAFVARDIFGEKRSEISKYKFLTLSLTSIASTFTSVRSLRYVIYPVQILFKSCKAVPVMLFGVILGKNYSMKKYVNVIIITCGVALFMGGGSSTSKGGSSDSTMIGFIMLSISLCFDGATGAYEEKLMANDHLGPFDLMFNIQLGKSVISFCALMATNSLPEFVDTLRTGGFSLVILGLTGAMGQVFIFITLSKFGALNLAIIGLFRKIVSLCLSFFLYGHTVNAIQSVGLVLAIVSMVANFFEKDKSSSDGGHGKKSRTNSTDIEGTIPKEGAPLLHDGHEPYRDDLTPTPSTATVSKLLEGTTTGTGYRTDGTVAKEAELIDLHSSVEAQPNKNQTNQKLLDI